MYFASRSISRYVARDSRLPEPHACIQRAASVAVPAIDPAPPAAVTTERNGITSDRAATGLSSAPLAVRVRR